MTRHHPEPIHPAAVHVRQPGIRILSQHQPPPLVTDPSAAASPASLVAAHVLRAFDTIGGDLVHVARSDRMAEQVAEAIRALAPDTPLLFFPAWDCLPYDRVTPSPDVMGRRMDGIRAWCEDGRGPLLMVTSLEAMLQRIPPRKVAAGARFAFRTDADLDREAFDAFLAANGYGGDGLVDEPGEAAIRQDVVDIFPPSLPKPVRIYLSPEGRILDLKAYDPVTQRTETGMESLVIGPASELAGAAPVETGEAPDTSMEKRLFALHGTLETLFDLTDGAPFCLGPEVEDRVAPYVAIIDEARSARDGASAAGGRASLYLDEAEWRAGLEKVRRIDLPLPEGGALPRFHGRPRSQRLLADFAGDALKSGLAVVLSGDDRVTALARRLGGLLGVEAKPVNDWAALETIRPGALYMAPFPLRRGFIDRDRALALVTVEDVLGPPAGEARARTLRLRLAEPELRIGDVVVHENHGVGILSALETTPIDGSDRDAVRLVYHGDASILVPMEEFGRLWRYGSEPEAVTLDRLHTDAWAKKREKVEADIAKAARHLVRLARERQKTMAPVIEPPKGKYAGFAARFPYVLTADQDAAIAEVLADLASGTPMNRLVVGDVGYGKTEVALRAAAAAAFSGHQVVVLAPTTVLARQHAMTFARRFAGTGVETALLSRAVSAAEAKAVKARLASGELGIVVATHAVLAKDVSFADLALLVVDEEHRFGARDKETMRKLAPALHVLTMSATPIPRTLQSALVGIQEISLLATPPARRRPVRTALVGFDPPSVRIALMRERRRAGQSFVVVPRIEDIERLEEELGKLAPELTLIVAHGKMPAAEMDDRVLRFANGEGDVLLSTNIIESGLDIPNANTMFVWRADRFGLAQLHQLRGRVGRGAAQGMAYLLTAPGEDIAPETRNRLQTMVELDRLGSGIDIAMRDLDLRGAGDLVGEEQAGHLKVIGISLYQKLLAEAVRALGGQKADSAATEISLGAPGHIPSDYVPDALVRLNLYSRLLRLADARDVDDLEDEIFDRFGEMPEPLARLLRITRLRIAAAALGIRDLSGGPKALAVTFAGTPPKTLLARWKTLGEATVKDGRHILAVSTETDEERLDLFERLCGGG
jgi:transcription-repair coupling factor (superfamily II helicase)